MQIEARNLTHLFGQTAAVDHANFVIERPMMVGVIGASGAGKSTMLRMINRLTDVSSVELVVDGRDVIIGTGLSLARARLSPAMSRRLQSLPAIRPARCAAALMKPPPRVWSIWHGGLGP